MTSYGLRQHDRLLYTNGHAPTEEARTLLVVRSEIAAATVDHTRAFRYPCSRNDSRPQADSVKELPGTTGNECIARAERSRGRQRELRSRAGIVQGTTIRSPIASKRL